MSMTAVGVDKVAADFLKAGATIKTRAGAGVGEVAKKVESSAKDFAPKGDRDHGDEKLAPSIRTSGEGVVREIGPTARHGRFMEFGTYKDAPQPFMGPALDKHGADLEEKLGDVAGDI